MKQSSSTAQNMLIEEVKVRGEEERWCSGVMLWSLRIKECKHLQ